MQLKFEAQNLDHVAIYGTTETSSQLIKKNVCDMRELGQGESKLVVGLVGPIASGKTTVSQILSDMGAVLAAQEFCSFSHSADRMS